VSETKLTVTKGQGTGNDFVFFSDPDGKKPITPEQVRWLTDRRFGVGGDGVIRAVRAEHIAEGRELLEQDSDVEWFMDYYNSDGSLSQMCGNGIRVFVLYLIEEGLTDLKMGQTIPVGTRAGIRDVQLSKTGFTVDMGRWRIEEEGPLVEAEGLKVGRPSVGINVGNPHLVVALAAQEELDALRLHDAPALDPEPAEGANVEFVVPADPMVVDGVGYAKMRVHERGSGETMSCGTGAVATALALRYWAGEGAPNHWQIEVPGGKLAVRMFPTEEGEHVSLSGPAELAYETEVAL